MQYSNPPRTGSGELACRCCTPERRGQSLGWRDLPRASEWLVGHTQQNQYWRTRGKETTTGQEEGNPGLLPLGPPAFRNVATAEKAEHGDFRGHATLTVITHRACCI